MSTPGKKDTPRAYLFKGDEDFQKTRELKKLLGWLVSGDFADFDLEQLEGDAATSDRVITGLNVPPFGSERRVVLVKHANKMHPDEQEKLAARLPGAPESGCLVLVTPAPEKVDGRPRKGSEVIGALSRAIRKMGEVHEFGGGTSKQKGAEADEFARTVFATARKNVDTKAMKLFRQRVGSDFALINTEAQKLISYSGDSDEITIEDVAAVTSETPEEKVFKLIDAIGAKNQALALSFLSELFESGDNPDADAPKTLSTIARHFRLIWQIKLLTSAGVRVFDKNSVSDEIRAQLPSEPNLLDVLSRQAWTRDRLAGQARSLSRADLVRCFAAIARADLMLKGIEGGIEDSRLVMELLVMDLARGSAQGRPRQQR